MRNIVILISGGGSNMAAIVRVAQRDNWLGRHGARVAAVISNRADAGGLSGWYPEVLEKYMTLFTSPPGRERYEVAFSELPATMTG